MIILPNSLQKPDTLTPTSTLPPQPEIVPVTVAPEPVHDITGIPQSSAPPAAIGEAFGARPWDDEEDAYQKSLADWRRDSTDKLDAAALNPGEAFKDADLSFASTPEDAHRGVISDAWLALHNDDAPIPDNHLLRAVMMQETSLRMFDQMVDSEENLFPLIQKAAQGRKDTKTLESELRVSAGNAEFVRTPDVAEGKSAMRNFHQWDKEAAKKPGYDPALRADYFEAWSETQQEVKQAVDHYRPELDTVFTAFERKEDYGEAAATAYDSLPEAERKPFLAALKIRANSLSQKDADAFSVNFFKKSMRDFGGLIDQGRVGAVVAMQSGGTVGWEDFLGSDAALAAKNQRDGSRLKDFRRRENFRADVIELQQETYDPIRYLSTGWMQRAEKVVYGTPGVLASSAAALAAPPLLYASLQESAYQSLRQKALARGDSEDEADRFASSLAPAAGAVTMVSERLGANLLLGKLPFFNKALTGAMDKIQSNVVRGVVRGGVAFAQEGTQEVGQNYAEPLVQDLGTALGMDVPEVQWLGKGGEFEGDWSENLDTFLAVAPLIVFGVAGGVDADARGRAFAAASTTELQAMGLTADAIAAIKSAKGQASLNSALDSAMRSRDPLSEEAKEAVHTLMQEQTDQRAAFEAAKSSGIVPHIVQTADGYAIHDGETGEIVATAPDMSGAMRIATAHSAAFDERRAEKVAYLATMLEGGAEALAMAPDSGAQNSFELGTVYTEATAAAEDPASIDQFHEQAAIREKINGGDGSATYAALGRNVQEVRAGVRTFTNRLFQGASITTVIHEMGHGMLSQMEAAGVIDRADKLAFVRAVDSVMGGQVQRRGDAQGQALALLPAGLADADVTDTMLGEAISEILEAEVLRTRKRAKDAKPLKISSGIISRNLTALASLLGPKRMSKFRALIEGARGVFGLSSARALAMKKAEREGRFDARSHEAFIDRLTGRDYQAEHAGIVREEHAALVGQDAFIPTENEPFSLAPARMVDALEINATARIKDPRVKAAMFKSMVEKLGLLKRDKDELGIAFGKGYKRRAIDDPRKVASIRKETAFREALLRSQYEDEAHAKHSGILHNEDIAKLWERPVFAALATTRADGSPDPFHGRLMSRSAAIGRGETFFNERKQGDYDGAEDVPPVVFGGKLTPDQAAGELFDAGLIKEPSPDALWDTLRREAASVDRMKGYMKAARVDVADARQRAKAEAKAWQKDRLKEEAANYSPRERMLRALAMLDGVLSVLPAELRGKIGGYTQLAKLGSDEARLKFLNARIAKADEEIEAWMKREHRADLDKLREKAKPTKDNPGEAKRGKIGVDAHRIFSWVDRYHNMTEEQVDGERLAIAREEERLADETIPGVIHPEALELANRARALDMLGGFDGKPAADQAAALAWLHGTYTFGRDEWGGKEAARLAEVAALQRTMLETLAAQKGVTLPSFEMPKFDNRTINGMTSDEAEPLLRKHDLRVKNALAAHKAKIKRMLDAGGVGSLAARQERRAFEQSNETRTILEAGSGEFLSFVQVLERLLGPGHELVTRWNDAVGQAQTQKTDAVLKADGEWVAALRAAFEASAGAPVSTLEAQRRLWEMSTNDTVTIDKVVSSGAARMAVELSDVPALLDGTTDPATYSLILDDLPALQAAWDAHQAEITQAQEAVAADEEGAAAKLAGIQRRKDLEISTRGESTTAPVKLSPMQAITLVLTSRQTRYAKNLADHGYTAEVIQQAVDQIGPDGMAIADWLGDFYQNNYEPLAAVFRDMFGVDLPREQNYSPFRAERGGADKDISGPQQDGMVPEGGFRANFTKTRAPSHSLAPSLQNAATVFQGHVASSEHWRAFAPLVREMKAVLGGLEIRQAIEANHGKALVSALDGWLLAFEQNGLKQRSMADGSARMIRAMQRNIAVLGLAFRFSSILKNYVLPMFGTARRIGVRNYLHGMARFAAGQIDYSRFRESDFITRRGAGGFSPEFRAAVSQMRSDKPTRTGNAVVWAMEQMGVADMRSTALGAAIAWDHHYRENLAAGMSEADADALAARQTEDDVRRTAQPIELAERSLFELSQSDMGRMLFMFATDARKESALFMEATRRAWQDNGAKGLLTNSEFRTTATAIWLTTGAVNTILSRVLMDMMDGGDDDEWFDEKNWSVPGILASALLGPVGGVPLLGTIASGFDRSPVSKAIQGIGAVKALAAAAWDGDIPSDDRVAWLERKIVTVLHGAGMFHKAAADIGAFGSALDQSFRILDNATD